MCICLLLDFGWEYYFVPRRNHLLLDTLYKILLSESSTLDYWSRLEIKPVSSKNIQELAHTNLHFRFLCDLYHLLFIQSEFSFAFISGYSQERKIWSHHFAMLPVESWSVHERLKWRRFGRVHWTFLILLFTSLLFSGPESSAAAAQEASALEQLAVLKVLVGCNNFERWGNGDGIEVSMSGWNEFVCNGMVCWIGWKEFSGQTILRGHVVLFEAKW